MKNWHTAFRSDPVPWLLATSEPWARYRTLIDLLERSEKRAEVVQCRDVLYKHPLVQGLVGDLATWPGRPLRRHNDPRHLIHTLAVVTDFGLGSNHPGLAAILRRITSYQDSEGALQITMVGSDPAGDSSTVRWGWMACDTALVLQSLLAGSLSQHPVTQQAFSHLLRTSHTDGWRCQGSERFVPPGRKDDPCPYATLLALRAVAQAPEGTTSRNWRGGAEWLLDLWRKKGRSKAHLFGIGTDFRKLKYPFVWFDILHFADVLSRFRALRGDPRLKEVVDTVLAKQDSEGRFTPESVWMAWKDWDFGQKKRPSPWLTLLVARIVKRYYGE